jgi:hypothetical protein
MTQPEQFDDAVRRTLSASAAEHVPADLATTILAATATRSQHRGWRSVLLRDRPRAARVATALVLAAVVVGVIGLAPILRGPSSPAANSSSGPTSAPTVRLAMDGLSLAIPADWNVTSPNLELHYETVLAYVGTGDGSMSCGSDYIPGLGGTCAQTLNLPVNSVVVKVSSWDGPPAPRGIVNEILAADPAAAVAIGDTTGAFEALPVAQVYEPGRADTVLEWTLQRPGGDPNKSYSIEAFLRGPDDSLIRVQLDAVIASVTVGN